MNHWNCPDVLADAVFVFAALGQPNAHGPNARQNSVVALHGLVWSPGFSRSRAPVGAQPAKAGTPNTGAPRFMVTIHARRRVPAIHEPGTSNLERRTSNLEPRTS